MSRLLIVLLLFAVPALADAHKAGTVAVNGKPTSAPFFREGRHIYYPVLDIARGLGKKAEFAAGRVTIEGKSEAAQLIEGRPCVTWAVLQRLIPDLQYGIRGDVAFFDSRPGISQKPVPGPRDTPKAMSSLESAVLDELNLARSNPSQYAQYLVELRGHFDGKISTQLGGVQINTQEGTAAVDEAVAFLKRQAPIGMLSGSAGLSLAAKDHVLDQASSGAIGHDGRDGSRPDQRMQRYGRWLHLSGENIYYGTGTARDIVMQLIIDDGVPDRGHRTNIFNPGFKCVGIYCGRHPTYKFMCVMDLAGGFEGR